MSRDEISFNEAEKIIEDHGIPFAGPGVVGVGIAGRGEEIKFLVSVEDEEAKQRLTEKYKGDEVCGFPVHVEVSHMVAIGDSEPDDAPEEYVARRISFAQEIIDRPGFIGLAVIALATVAFITIR